MLRFGMIPTINTSKRVSRQTANTIDHIIRNSTMHTGSKREFIKTDSCNDFPIFFCYKYIARKKDAEKKFIYKRKFSNQSIGTLKLTL